MWLLVVYPCELSDWLQKPLITGDDNCDCLSEEWHVCVTCKHVTVNVTSQLFCPKISSSVGAVHLGGTFLREERLQDKYLQKIIWWYCLLNLKENVTKNTMGHQNPHLSKTNAHDGECDKDAPDHCSLIQIFSSVAPLNKCVKARSLWRLWANV